MPSTSTQLDPPREALDARLGDRMFARTGNEHSPRKGWC
jgi:hypothetical protein